MSMDFWGMGAGYSNGAMGGRWAGVGVGMRDGADFDKVIPTTIEKQDVLKNADMVSPKNVNANFFKNSFTNVSELTANDLGQGKYTNMENNMWSRDQLADPLSSQLFQQVTAQTELFSVRDVPIKTAADNGSNIAMGDGVFVEENPKKDDVNTSMPNSNFLRDWSQMQTWRNKMNASAVIIDPPPPVTTGSGTTTTATNGNGTNSPTKTGHIFMQV